MIVSVFWLLVTLKGNNKQTNLFVIMIWIIFCFVREIVAISVSLLGSSYLVCLCRIYMLVLLEEVGRLIIVKKWPNHSKNKGVCIGILCASLECIYFISFKRFIIVLAGDEMIIMTSIVNLIGVLFERAYSFVAHIGLTILVCSEKKQFIIAAILMHTLLNIGALFFLKGFFNLLEAEVWGFTISIVIIMIAMAIKKHKILV